MSEKLINLFVVLGPAYVVLGLLMVAMSDNAVATNIGLLMISQPLWAWTLKYLYPSPQSHE